MKNQLRAALIVEAIVLAIAFAFSVVYFCMGWYRSSHVLDVLLVVLWVLVAGVLLVAFRSRSLEREAIVRRFYVSDEWIYNHEIGYAPLARIVPDRDPYEFVTFAADALAKMSYGFEVANPPADFQPRFLIESTSFQFHFVGEEAAPEDQSVVVDQWKGRLERIDEHEVAGRHAHATVGAFANAKELARLLDANAGMGASWDAGEAATGAVALGARDGSGALTAGASAIGADAGLAHAAGISGGSSVSNAGAAPDAPDASAAAPTAPTATDTLMADLSALDALNSHSAESDGVR